MNKFTIKRSLFILFLVLTTCLVEAQLANNSRSKLITITSDTTTIDSLSIIAGSFSIIALNGKTVLPNDYQVDYGKSLLLSKTLRGTFSISYKVFSMLFSKPFYHKSAKQYITKKNDTTFKSSFPLYDNNEDEYGGSLETNGSISRGISVGNNQDIIMNSNLNLQISGDLTETIKLEGSISDNNIPIQPDGNSQQIQDFDKVFIRMYTKQNQAVFGDYEINDRNGSLLKYHKKGQGIMAEMNTKKTSFTESSQAAIAIAKGKTCQKFFQGIEGNQGPYKITGCDNELYIVVLSGTEKVYVDGMLKKRGENFDYTIDYNTGEIFFTPYMPITKDSRISVNFEYSDKNYARFMVASNNSFETKRSKTWVNILSESDNKNQPLQQNLNDSRKRLLAETGDYPTYVDGGMLDSSKSKSKIYYYKKDTIVRGQEFKNIYALSTENATDEYSVTFSYVGEKQGDYAQFQSNANGKAFKWVSPSGTVHNGNYMPVVVLIAPKKKQVTTIGNEFKITKNIHSFVEMGISNNDANTFSSKDDQNNNGLALRFGINHRIKLDTVTHYIETQFSQSIIDKRFDPFDSYKPIEFNRDWNIKSKSIGNEYLSAIDVKSMLSLGELGYRFEVLTIANKLDGNKHSINGNLRKKSYLLNYTASTMQSKDTTHKSMFNKYSVTGSKQVRKVIVGINTQQEYNRWDTKNDEISILSSRFVSEKGFISKSDSLNWLCNLSSEIRQDFIADSLNNNFMKSTKSYDYKSQLGITKNQNHTAKVVFNYRIVNPQNAEKSKQEKNMSGRLEHQLVLFKKLITTNTFFQLGSGLELKKTYTYIEVTPGQGVYMWNETTDYNGNGKADLNEFEIAKYKYQANYVKVFIPTNDYISTFSNQYSEIVTIDPRSVIKNTNFIGSTISKFYNITNYKCTYKTIENDFLKNTNPFRTFKNDTSLAAISSYISNTIYFNKTSSKFTTNYTYSKEENKTLTSNGWEEFGQIKHTINNRIEIISGLSLLVKAEKGFKKNNIQAAFMDNKDYQIDIKIIEPKFTWQINPYRAFDLLSGLANLENKNNEHAVKETVGTEIRISSQKALKLTFNAKYIRIKYNANTNTSLAYTMLEGLLPGNNMTWEAMAQNNIGKYLKLSFMYQGQKSESTKVLHTGSIQLSAFF